MLPIAAIAAVGVALSRPDSTPISAVDLVGRPPLTDRIAFATPADAKRTRQRLRRYVFGTAEVPDGLPVVERGVEDAAFTSGLPNLARIDRLTVAMSFGFTSIAYHVIPRKENDRLLIYHSGHREDLVGDKRTIAHFLEGGYALLVFAMPFNGFNTNPETVETSCGRIRLERGPASAYHDALACVAFALRYFVEPVAVGLNYTRRLGYQLTAMTGLSGGGWTTMLYAALDPRVQRSYPVAGSMPHYVTARSCPGDTPASVARCFGDLEQRIPGLYSIANHLELYALGSWGRNREQLAIYNVYDRCCFAGTSFRGWTPRVQAALHRLGSGTYSAMGDTTHRDHLISRFALGVIEKDLRSAVEAGRE